MTHQVSVPAFEGPIDLLLQLVSAHQVDIYDVPLAEVVDGFLAEVAAWEAVDLPTLSGFLVVAAVLVEMKSRRLLPGPDEVDPDEELVGWEERDLLLARLLECQAYAAAGDAFSLLMERSARSVPRTAGLDEGFVVHAPDLLAGVTAQMVADAYLSVAEAKPVPRVDLYHVTVDMVTVAETVTGVARRLARERRLSFRELTSHLGTRMEVIVHFLALLELCKLGRVDLSQGTTFGDLEVTWVGGEGADRVEVGVGVPGGPDIDDYEGER